LKRAWPARPEPFPPPFRTLLEQILRRGARILGARREAVRARTRALQQSGTFAGHRPYARGDDLRRIDWNAVARTGSLFVKLLEEDERRLTTIVVDTSASMLAGAPPRLCAAQRIAAILGGLALVQLDGVQIHAAGADETFTGRGGVPALLEHLAALPTAAEDMAAAAWSLVVRGAPGRVHWLSDFADPRATERALRVLRRAGCRVVGWLPAIADDHGVEPGGWTVVADPETGEELTVAADAALCAALRHELELLRRQQDHVFASCGFPLQRLSLPAADFSIGAWLEAGWSYRR
jgi:uncharacterized protein (DUF58 family)